LNTKLFVIYCDTSDIWNITTIKIDEQFICMSAEHLFCEKDDPESSTIEEAMRRSNWQK